MIAKWMISLYPARWRERYEDEMLELLREYPITWRTVADLLASALNAHLDPCFRPAEASPVERERRNRQAHRSTAWAFPLLITGYMCLLDGLDDALFPWNQAHAGIWQFKLGSEIAVATAVLVFLLIALPVALAATIARRRVTDGLLRFTLPSIIVIVLAISVHILYTAVWGYAIWSLPTPTVQEMAHAAHRHIWTGDGWRLQIVGAVLWMGLMTAHIVRGLWQSFVSLTSAPLSITDKDAHHGSHADGRYSGARSHV